MATKTKINKIIKTLITYDFFLFLSSGLLAPIFAVFILENIENKLEIIGYIQAIYWLTRVITIIPISKYMDKCKGENDEYWFLVFGSFLVSIIPLFYIISSESWHIYLLQIINAIGYSMAVSAWRILFTNHVDKKIIGFEWSMEDVSVGISISISATVGAFIASKFGFNFLFVIMTIFGLISTLVLLTIKKLVVKKPPKPILPKRPRTPLKIDSFK
jgi:predicted MFS family arabinose efflux permease